MKVLSFGSLNIDYVYTVDHFVQKGETISSGGLNVFCGGKGLNQSIAFAKAGAEVYHAGAIGEDGMFLVEQMKAAGVDTTNVKVLTEVRTGNAIIQNDAEGDNCIILYGGANQAITKEQVDEVLKDFEAGDYLVLQNEINELAYIVEQAGKKGIRIVLNPSPMNEKILALDLTKVSVFMLNEIEAGQLLQTEPAADQERGIELARALVEKWPQAAVVLTMGSNGSVYVDQNQTVTQDIYKVKAVDTTAAGDTFTGFFIAGLIAGLEVKEAMDQASRASAIAVSRPGASPSIPTLAEVKAWQIDALIFDVDGTLWDSTESVAVAYNKAMKEFGTSLRVDADRLKQLFGKPMDIIFQELLPGAAPEECQALSDRCIDLEAEGLMADSEETIRKMIYEGVGEMFKTMSERYPLFIVSNCQAGYIEIFLERSGYGEYVKGHLCFGDTGTSKGQTILRLMREFGLKNPVYVGDTQGDADACKEAGIPIVYCKYGFGKIQDPQWEIEKPMDLAQLF